MNIISIPQNADTFDLVVIGAGICGLNALYAAAQYLPKGSRALLLDEKDAAGGMWNTTYDFVRLHQPHAMFTVGNLPWKWDKPDDYLATRDEVQTHLASTLHRTGKLANPRVKSLFKRRVHSCDEVQTDQGWRAAVSYGYADAPDSHKTVYAKRAIFATGINAHTADPINVTSTNVTSITPNKLRETLAQNPDAPLFAVGGGKTGMDVCLNAIQQNPNRAVTLINGRGVHFMNRDVYFPKGRARWNTGLPSSRILQAFATQFDGDNEDALLTTLRRDYSTDPMAPNGGFLYGFQSQTEQMALTSGLAETITGYLDDVTDSPTGPHLILRNGDTKPIPEGSIFVNCTGSFFHKTAQNPARPCLSAHDTILSITSQNSFHFLSSVAGFFMTHLLYRDQLRGNGFHVFNQEALFIEDRDAWFGASTAQGYLNMILAVRCLPLTLLHNCGMDFDKWYPLPRRVKAIIQMKLTAQRDYEHCQRALTRVAERFESAVPETL